MFNHIKSQTFEGLKTFIFHCLTVLDFQTSFTLCLNKIVLFGICYLVAVDDVGEKKGEEENEDDGDKDEANC